MLILFDAYHYLYRAFHALPPLTTKAGEPVGAVFGFMRIILKLIRQLQPSHLAVCWDSKPRQRLAIDASYKANRPPAPQELKTQFVLAREIVAAWGLASVEVENLEADDLIATLSAYAKKNSLETLIVTSDKDALQLVDGLVKVYMEHRNEIVDESGVKKRFGCEPAMLTHFFALTGDNADNIPGVPGIGEKTAQDLVARFGSIDAILKATGDPASAMTPKIRKNLLEHEDRLRKNLLLVTLKTDAPIAVTTAELALPESLLNTRFETMLMQLGFGSVLKELSEGGKPQRSLPNPGDERFYFLAPELAELNWPFVENANCVKITYEYKALLHRHAGLKEKLKGELLDLKLLAWIANPSEESWDMAWLTTKYGDGDPIKAALSLKQRLQENNLWALYKEVELPLSVTLTRMEECGIHVDGLVLEELGRQWDKELIALRQAVLQLAGAGADLNLNSPKQLGFILFEKLGLPKIKKTKTGYSTNEEVLLKLKGAHPVVEKILEHRELSKLRSTYIEGLLAAIIPRTNAIHATFHQEGTQTGRLSCSNPNLQNIPIRTERGLMIRKTFIPSKPRWIFLSLDYSQIDLRAMAHLSGDKNLIAFFKEDRDIHAETARLVLAGAAPRISAPGAPGAEVSDLGPAPQGPLRAGTQCVPRSPLPPAAAGARDQVTAAMRRQAKAINFGILYGMGPRSLAQEINVSMEEAQYFIDRYYQRFPDVEAWRRQTIERARRDGFVTTLLGRKRYLEHINAAAPHLREFAERTAVNTPVQGTSADIIKLAMLQIEGYINQEGLQARMLIQVHDELLLEGPQEEIEIFTPKLKEIMEKARGLLVPLKVNAKMGPNWKDLVS